MNYDCNHDCSAIYEAYEKGRRDMLEEILDEIHGRDERQAVCLDEEEKNN